MFTIIFIAKIPLQFQIKQELQGGGCGFALDPLPRLCPGLVGYLGGPQTPCLTRKETLVTALTEVVYSVGLETFWAVVENTEADKLCLLVKDL